MPPGVKKEKLATINDALDKKAFRDQLLSTFVMAPLFGFLLYPVLGWRGMELWTDTLPSWSICIRDVVIMILGCDTMFYWAHRALHTKALYPYHKQHHEYKLTNVWASEYFGFFDLVCNLAPGLIPGVLIGTHFQLLMFFTGLRGWQTVQSHAGYGLPFDPINMSVVVVWLTSSAVLPCLCFVPVFLSLGVSRRLSRVSLRLSASPLTLTL